MPKKRADYELLSPAGNFEKLKAAFLYGADAVYCAGKQFGMRSAADNFTVEELYGACAYAHERGKKLYLTVNTIPRTEEYPALRQFLYDIRDAGIDAVIATDLGVIATVRQIIPGMEIHLSTQASVMSPAAALAYASMGFKRLVLARELTLGDIRAIREALPDEVDLEAFVHGSMCVSISGRCLLANEFNGRDGNRGTCSQPCRWNYVLVEEKHPEAPVPIEQNENGTIILSSKDMCTIGLIPELMECGIRSFKIEGRMKSAYYTAVVTNTYRMAMDAYLEDPEHFRVNPDWMAELESVSHRTYGTGFYLDHPMENPQLVEVCGYIREKAYYAVAEQGGECPGQVLSDGEGTLFRFRQRNKVSVGERVELLTPGSVGQPFVIREMYDESGAPIDSVPHPNMYFYVRVPFAVHPGDIMRSGLSRGLDVRPPDRAEVRG
ncbi:MAG: U32 family peptidase [Clostridia bacterium]|nr:U32 family peptidase [Clostridia bacterium]